jgi:hypothetical protein
MQKHLSFSFAAIASGDETVDTARQRSFATSAGTCDQQHLSWLEFKGNVLNGQFGTYAILERKVFDNQRGFSHHTTKKFKTPKVLKSFRVFEDVMFNRFAAPALTSSALAFGKYMCLL